MQNKTSFAINSQFSERVTSEFPLFTRFLELYYEYAQLKGNSVSVVQDRNFDVDIDSALDAQLDRFLTICGPDIPKTTAISKPLLIKLLNELYSSKGTEKSFKLLFKLLYNIEVDITSPSSQILKASAGDWRQESFLTIETIQGDADLLSTSILKVANSTGEYAIEPLRVVDVGLNAYRIYFVSYNKINVEIGDFLYIYSDTGISYKAVVRPSLNGVKILKPGKRFKVGQIYIVAGTTSNTYLKVNEITSLGEIKTLEIIQHGYTHARNLNAYISPFKTVPSSNYSLDSVEDPPGSGKYTYTLNISDIVYDIVERNIAYGSANSYFLEDYTDLELYAGTKLFEYDNSGGNELLPDSNITAEITFEEYVASKATLAFVYAGYTRIRGKYRTEAGQLSNDRIKLQDNYYYQIFSYVVNSEFNIDRYEAVVNKLLHPAGFKMFSNISKNENIDLTDQISITNNYKFVNTNDDTLECTETFTLNKYATVNNYELGWTVEGNNGYFSESYPAETYTGTRILEFNTPIADALNLTENFTITKL